MSLTWHERARKALRSSPAVRGVGIPIYRAYARRVLVGPEPRVVANSMPKAGTHLLMAVLDGLPQMRFSGLHGDLSTLGWGERTGADGAVELDWTRVTRTLGRLRTGQYMTAHLPHSDRLAAALAGAGARSLVIVRDPRDVAVSETFYVCALARHPQHRRYTRLATFGERLMLTITGAEGDEQGPPVPSIATRIGRYERWLDAPGVLVTRFEQLVGSRGGGSDEAQLAELRRIAEHVRRPLADAELERTARSIWSPTAATFRRSTIGDWRNHFGDEHLAAFERMAGEAMRRIGYPLGG
jgi:hypothetical protein